MQLDRSLRRGGALRVEDGRTGEGGDLRCSVRVGREGRGVERFADAVYRACRIAVVGTVDEARHRAQIRAGAGNAACVDPTALLVDGHARDAGMSLARLAERHCHGDARAVIGPVCDTRRPLWVPLHVDGELALTDSTLGVRHRKGNDTLATGGFRPRWPGSRDLAVSGRDHRRDGAGDRTAAPDTREVQASAHLARERVVLPRQADHLHRTAGAAADVALLPERRATGRVRRGNPDHERDIRRETAVRRDRHLNVLPGARLRIRSRHHRHRGATLRHDERGAGVGDHVVKTRPVTDAATLPLGHRVIKLHGVCGARCNRAAHRRELRLRILRDDDDRNRQHRPLVLAHDTDRNCAGV